MTKAAVKTADVADINQYMVTQEPYYRPVSTEVELYEAATACACR